jgi:DUF1680 family protein
VNGRRQNGLAVPGRFAAIHREWKTGDQVDLELPLKLRLDPIDAQHPDPVALLRGPLVLMAVKPQQDNPVPAIARRELLAAKRISQRQWQIHPSQASQGPVTLLPFTEIGDRPYTTYLKTT